MKVSQPASLADHKNPLFFPYSPHSSCSHPSVWLSVCRCACQAVRGTRSTFSLFAKNLQKKTKSFVERCSVILWGRLRAESEEAKSIFPRRSSQLTSASSTFHHKFRASTFLAKICRFWDFQVLKLLKGSNYFRVSQHEDTIKTGEQKCPISRIPYSLLRQSAFCPFRKCGGNTVHKSPKVDIHTILEPWNQ